MYILAKPASGDGYDVTIHGVTHNDAVVEAWQVLGGVVFDIDSDEPFTKEPSRWINSD